MKRNYNISVLAFCLTSLLLCEQTQSGRLTAGNDDQDHNFELEAIPLEDAYDLLTTTERRAHRFADEDDRTYGVIVDCGSSGTRAHLYEWDSELSYPELLHDVEPMRNTDGKPLSKKFSPSLASFADEPREKLEEYIKQVLDYIELYIPREKHPFTGVYILATAGMRLLDEKDQERIMKDLSSYIKREYKFAKVKTSVIPGAHEGMYQWISVNAKAKRFLGQGTSYRTKTFGVIEMGGASIQVTYMMRPGVKKLTMSSLPDDETRRVYEAQIVEPQLSRHDKPENTYMLHSTTFLGFGSNSAHELYLDLLIHKFLASNGWRKFVKWSKNILFGCAQPPVDHKDELIIEDPCSPKGYLSETPLKKPKAMLTNKDRTLGYLLDDDEPYFSFKLKGTGHYTKCRNLVKEMLKLAKKERLNCKPQDEKQCTMLLLGEQFIPFQSTDFLGIGDIYYTTNLMLKSAGTYEHQKVIKKTQKICNSSYESLKKHFDYLHEKPQLRSRIYEECFKAVWVDTFLVKGLMMPTDLSTLSTVGKINNDDLEWTLGAVLDKSLAIESAADTNAEQMFGSADRGLLNLKATLETPKYDHPKVLPVIREEDEEELDLGLDDQ